MSKISIGYLSGLGTCHQGHQLTKTLELQFLLSCICSLAYQINSINFHELLFNNFHWVHQSLLNDDPSARCMDANDLICILAILYLIFFIS